MQLFEASSSSLLLTKPFRAFVLVGVGMGDRPPPPAQPLKQNPPSPHLFNASANKAQTLRQVAVKIEAIPEKRV